MFLQLIGQRTYEENLQTYKLIYTFFIPIIIYVILYGHINFINLYFSKVDIQYVKKRDLY